MFFALLFDEDENKWRILWPAWPNVEQAKERAIMAAKFHGLNPDEHAKVMELIPFPFTKRVEDFKLKEIKKGE